MFSNSLSVFISNTDSKESQMINHIGNGISSTGCGHNLYLLALQLISAL